MEVAGVVIGAVALVGVFEDCIELLSQISATRSIEKDYALLATRLDLQRALLLEWAERIKIYDDRQYDLRLDDPIIAPAIYKALDCIRQLLKDGNVLQRRYGVRRVGLQDTIESSTAVSSQLMSRLRDNPLALRFRRDNPVPQYDQNGLDHEPSSGVKRSWNDPPMPSMPPIRQDRSLNGSHRNKRPRNDSQLLQTDQALQLPDGHREGKFSSFEKIRWVIKDKEQFDTLVRDLAGIIADMDKLIPPQGGDDLTHNVLKHDIQKLTKVRELRMVMLSSFADNGNLINVTKQTIDRVCTRLILDRLWFRLIDDRRYNIAEAHSNTFEWAIEPPATGAAWDNLAQWLRSGSDVYWIHGKPGSGKSTLMKFLYNHSKTLSSLHTWAGTRRLTMASFFLWNIGSPEQGSQESLARGLLYHVLRRNPALIPVVLTHMWQEAQSGAVDLRAPSYIETKTAFERLGAEDTAGAYAFFIDGLDEFTGNHRDGISFVKGLATSANIKILVSSRPIDTCVAAFSSAPKLRLQDLTASDIGRYVSDALQSHTYSANYNDATVGVLVGDIQRKADGVFLWVVLACRALLEGFEAYDSVEELRRRVDELPPELEDLFRHILNGLPTRYLQQAAQLLRVCYIHRLLRIESRIPAVHLAWAHEKNMETCAMDDLMKHTLNETKARITRFEGRLRSRCRGLLEVHTSTIKNESNVDFMHRTVFEFLNTPNVWDLDCLQINDHAFDVNTVLAYMSCYALYNATRNGIADEYIFWTTFVYTQQVEISSPLNTPRLLNRLGFALLHKTGGEKPSPSPLTDSSLDTVAVLLAVELDLTTFARRNNLREFIALRRLDIHEHRSGHSLLYHAFCKPLWHTTRTTESDFPCSPEMVDLLIRAGSEPNESIALSGNDMITCWDTWMESQYMDTKEDYRAVEDAEITMIMIRAGAALVPPNPDEPTIGTAHVATEDLRARLRDAVEKWLKLAPTIPELQDRDKLEALCKEITAAVAASYQPNYSGEGRQTHAPEASS